ncbi:MAG: putative toxin-antitoxin system toxin component, PIN family [Actinomycetota bacterium]|nr:MAG: putative toxin-antitoxin system toxin component, PIN family [Actinomycetota bacterium]
MKVVLDSNIYIAAFSSRGLCSSLFELCLDSTTILISEHIISEVSKNLLKKIKLPADKANDIIIYLREQCIVKGYKKLSDKTCRDVDDDNILALARDNQADYIITGDKDLLILKKFDLIPIIDPRKFWSIIKKKEGNSKNTMN